MKETLAAAMVMLSVWTRSRPLLDPFCGSGTIPIEAAMIGRNMAPGFNRAFHWDSGRKSTMTPPSSCSVKPRPPSIMRPHYKLPARTWMKTN